MFKSKKAKIIFIVAVLAVVGVAVALISIFTSQPQLLAPKNDLQAYNQRVSEKNLSVQEYATKFIQLENLNAENASKLSFYYEINTSLELLEPYMFEVLHFTYRSKDFNGEAKSLAKLIKNSEKTYDEFFEYADANLLSFLEQSAKSEQDQNSYTELFLEHYEILTEINISVYENLARIIDSSCQRGYKVNDYTVTFLNSVVGSARRVYDKNVDSKALLVLTSNNISALQTITFTEQSLQTIEAQFDIIAQEEIE